MSFVLDASIALSWCFLDESDKISTDLLERLESEPAFVPAIWPLELGNALLTAERKNGYLMLESLRFSLF